MEYYTMGYCEAGGWIKDQSFLAVYCSAEGLSANRVGFTHLKHPTNFQLRRVGQVYDISRRVS